MNIVSRAHAIARNKSLMRVMTILAVVSMVMAVHGATAANKFGSNDPGCTPGSYKLPSTTPHVLKHPVVSLIFWGSAWPNPQLTNGQTGNISAGAVTGAIQDLMAGPYFSWLNQYYGAGAPRLLA